MRNYILYTFCLLFFSCGSDHSGEKKTGLASYFVSISDNEDKGVKEIISSFGGEVEYGFSKGGGADQENRNAFWLDVRKSSTIDNLSVDAKLLASGIALVFYRNLKDERTKYTHIDVRVTKQDTKVNESFSIKLLDSALACFKIVVSVADYIDGENYKGLSEKILLNSDLQEGVDAQSNKKLIEIVKNLRKEQGAVKEIIPIGFRDLTLPSGKQFFYFSNYVVFENSNYPLSIVINKDTADDKVHFFNYNF